MKLTWFGGRALRVHLGGSILLVDPDTAAAEVNQTEIRSGVDRIIGLGGDELKQVDAERWFPRRSAPQLDGPHPLELLSIGPDTCLLHAEMDPPLLVSNALQLPRLGRWGDGAVIVTFGDRGARIAEAIAASDLVRPRRLVLAAEDEVVDAFINRISQFDEEIWGGMAFSSLEPGLALEV